MKTKLFQLSGLANREAFVIFGDVYYEFNLSVLPIRSSHPSGESTSEWS